MRPVLSHCPGCIAARMRALALAAFAALLASCAGTGGTARDDAALARFEAAAGEPVESFRFVRLQGYTALGESHIAVWTRPKEAWLLRVDLPCRDLGWSSAIGLTSSLGRVYSRFDRVLVGRQRCRIADIRPVDVAALRDSEREASSTAVEAQPREDAQSDGGT